MYTHICSGRSAICCASLRMFSGDAGAHWAPPREVKEPRTKGLEKRKRAVPEAFAMPAPPELLS